MSGRPDYATLAGAMPRSVAERYGHARLLAELQEAARREGGRCLAPVWLGCQAKLEFECRRNHRFFSRPRPIREGTWCPECRRRPEAKLAAMQALARTWGGYCLSEEYEPAEPGMRWRCVAGHEWRAKAAAIRSGSWCPWCAGKLTMADLQALAAKHDGRCLSESLAEGAGDRCMRWECKEGHQFKVRRRCVASGQWCPECRKDDGAWRKAVARAQELGGECLVSGDHPATERVGWRCAEGHTWATPASRIAQGSWCSRCEGYRLTLAEMQAMAAERGGRCLSREFVNVWAELKWQCAEGHRWTAPPLGLRYRGVWCPTCSGATPRIPDLWAAALAEARKHGGACVGDRSKAATQSTRWRCSLGHVFGMSPIRIASGRWCSHCAGTRLNIEHMRAMAAERGGRCISRKYIDAKTKLQWECEKGHRWWAMPGGLRNAGSWCPQCAWDRLSEIRRGEARDRR